MFDPSETVTPPKPPPAGLADAIDKWAAEAGASRPGLEEVRLDGNDRVLIPFTQTVAEIVVHYIDYKTIRSYIRCNGKDCLLCRIGRHTDARDLLPMYDPAARAVMVLPVSPNMRPGALRPQLAAALRRLKDGDRVLLVVRKDDKVHFTVAVLDLPADADDGSQQIAAFLEKFNCGTIDLTNVYQTLSNVEMASIPEIADIMKLRGIAL